MFEQVDKFDDYRQEKLRQVEENTVFFSEWIKNQSFNQDESCLYDRLSVSQEQYHVQVSYRPDKHHRSSTVSTLVTKAQEHSSFKHWLNEAIKHMKAKREEMKG